MTENNQGALVTRRAAHFHERAAQYGRLALEASDPVFREKFSAIATLYRQHAEDLERSRRRPGAASGS